MYLEIEDEEDNNISFHLFNIWQYTKQFHIPHMGGRAFSSILQIKQLKLNVDIWVD